jgi:hypothetical protein
LKHNPERASLAAARFPPSATKRTPVIDLHTFSRYLRELLSGAWGIVGDLLTVVSIASFYVPRLESIRPVLFGAVAVAFVGSGYRLYLRQQAAIADRDGQIEDLRRSKFSAETREVVENHYRGLDRPQKVAIRHLLAAGDVTDRQALDYLRSKGMAQNYGSIFSALEQTPLVRRVSQPTGRDRLFTYTGLYTINPAFRSLLVELVEADPESKA